jgi:hypothetical protein
MSTHDWHTISPFSVGKQTTEISSKGRQRGTKAALTNCACGWTLLALVVRLASHRERGFLFRPVQYCDAVACKCPAVTLRANTATIFPELLARSVASTCAWPGQNRWCRTITIVWCSIVHAVSSTACRNARGRAGRRGTAWCLARAVRAGKAQGVTASGADPEAWGELSAPMQALPERQRKFVIATATY